MSVRGPRAGRVPKELWRGLEFSAVLWTVWLYKVLNGNEHWSARTVALRQRVIATEWFNRDTLYAGVLKMSQFPPSVKCGGITEIPNLINEIIISRTLKMSTILIHLRCIMRASLEAHD
jgi:hypothetical protein